MHFQRRNLPIRVVLRVNMRPQWPHSWRETATAEIFTTHKESIGRRLGSIDLRIARRVTIEKTNRQTNRSSVINYQSLLFNLLGESLLVCHFILHKSKKENV